MTTRLPNRISLSSRIFPATMENMPIQPAEARTDNTLISSRSNDEYLPTWKAALQNWRQLGLSVKESECFFFFMRLKHSLSLQDTGRDENSFYEKQDHDNWMNLSNREHNLACTNLGKESISSCLSYIAGKTF